MGRETEPHNAGARIWRAGAGYLLTHIGLIILGSAVLAWVMALITRGLGGNATVAAVVAVIVLVFFFAVFGWFLTLRARTVLTVTDEFVTVSNGGTIEHEFARASTTFDSRVMRTFLNGLPGTGEQRGLSATTKQTTNARTIPLDFLSRRRFALLFESLRTAESCVHLAELRTTAGLNPTQSTQLGDGNTPSALLPQPSRTHGVAVSQAFPIDRSLILARTAGRLLRALLLTALGAAAVFAFWTLDLYVILKIIICVALAVAFYFSPFVRRAILATIFGPFLVVWHLTMLLWQAARTPASIAVSNEEIRVGLSRFALDKVAEVSLTPPSYPAHARRLTLRTRRGLARAWDLGHTEPKIFVEAGFRDYGTFAQAVTEAAASASVTLVWDLD